VSRKDITASVTDIRRDPDELTRVVKEILSVRRMAVAEFEGIEFVWSDWEEGHAEEALEVVTRLWPKKAHSIAHRLSQKGVMMVLAE
jgi:hypothetical protein